MKAWVLAPVLALAFFFSFASPGKAQGADIEAVIGAQLDAFKADAFDEAFTFASPMIQGIFRTPEVFGQMVRNGYPMVWRPGEVRFLELRDRDGRFYQLVEITDAKGANHVLAYEMIELDGAWKINGVRLLKAPDVAA
ncbi:MAG: DUF4864 domain-containing protein [Pseudomonadota bacterium]